MAKAPGLTSQQACRQLVGELQTFVEGEKRIDFRTELYKSLPSVIITAYCLFAVALLLVGYGIGEAGESASITTVLNAIVLLIVATVNIILVARGVRIQKLWYVTRLEKGLGPLIRSPCACPWSPASYPSEEILILRSQVTVKVYRDSQLVNVPSSLLVEGDVMQLHPKQHAPAMVKVANGVDSNAISIGEIPDPRYFDHVALHGASVAFIEDGPSVDFVVLKAPVVSLLRDSLHYSAPETFILREKALLEKLLAYVVIPVCFVTLFVINIIRYVTLTDYFLNWQDTVLSWTVYSVIPLLALPMHMVWVIMNTYAISRISLLLGLTTSTSWFGRIPRFFINILDFFKVLICPYRYPLLQLYQQFGHLTAICAVDKEFVLTGSLPTPEKVFFLKGNKTSGELLASKRSSFKSQQSKQSHIDASQDKETDERECAAEISATLGQDLVGSCPMDISETKSLSTISEAEPVEIVTEILDITPSRESTSGLAFDDPDWLHYLKSLKPIGLNALCSSHFPQDSISSQVFHLCGLSQHLLKTQCCCKLGMEIGVSEFSLGRLKQRHLVYAIGDPLSLADTTTALNSKTGRNLIQSVRSEAVQSHLISTIIQDSDDSILQMSRGSGDMITSCCCDFWDGEDLQPMTEFESGAILDFYKRRSLDSYCIALSYTPLLDVNHSKLLSVDSSTGLYLPSSELQASSEHYPNSSDEEMESSAQQPISAQDVLAVIRNQVFLGMVSLRYRPKADVVALVQDLRVSGIRFIHFTAENDIKGKIFAERLGLEAGWNCHISLGSPSPDDNLNMDGLSLSTSASSLNSVLYGYQSYILAKLPKGIENIRPHLENVDNVPLLVPLFTDCSPSAVREMIQIMQENGEVVLILGNSWVRENIPIFSQADFGLSLDPTSDDSQLTCCCKCPSSTASSRTHMENTGWPSPLQVASLLNSYHSRLHFQRDADVMLRVVICDSRHLLGCIKRSLLYGLGCVLTVGMLLVLATLFFLPPPLSGSHTFWLILFTIPLMTLSLLSTRSSPDIKKRMPDRKKKVWNDKWIFTVYFCVAFLPSSVVCLIIFGLTLDELCATLPSSDCHSILGNQNASNVSGVGWQLTSSQGLRLSQDFTLLFLNGYFSLLSLHFVHRTDQLWKLWRHVGWLYVIAIVFSNVLQVVYFAVSQVLDVRTSKINGEMVWTIDDIPVSAWAVGLVWPFVQLPLQEFVKWHDRRMFVKTQRRLRLSFETKLGMNSPF